MSPEEHHAEALALKEKGSVLYKQGVFTEALELYDEAAMKLPVSY